MPPNQPDVCEILHGRAARTAEFRHTRIEPPTPTWTRGEAPDLMKTGRLVLLGTGTCRLEPRRSTSAVLIELGELRWVFDFGRGTALRLVELGLHQDDVSHIVLSHFHTDHWSDLLPYLQAASHSPSDPRRTDLHIHASSAVIAKLYALFALFGPDELIVEKHFRVHLHAITTGTSRIGGHEFAFVHLPPAGNHGLRFETRETVCALTGDSHFHQQEIDFLRGADLAVIDAGHLTDEEIVVLAAASEVSRLVCSHLYREIDGDRLNRLATDRGYRGRLLVGSDLQSFQL